MNVVCLGLALAMTGPTTAIAQSTHEYRVIPASDDHGPYMLFVDVASITRTGGANLRYWETSVYRTPWNLRLSGEVRSFVSLTEVNCATSEFRSLVVIAYDSRGSVTVHNPQPDPWNFAPPNTRIADTVALVCRGEDTTSVGWLDYDDRDPIYEANRTFNHSE